MTQPATLLSFPKPTVSDPSVLLCGGVELAKEMERLAPTARLRDAWRAWGAHTAFLLDEVAPVKARK